MKNLSALLLLTSMTLLAACGSQTLSEGTTTADATSTGSSTSVTNTSTGVGNINNLPAAYSQRVQIGGNGSSNASLAISSSLPCYSASGGSVSPLCTSKKLKVKITPLTAANLVIQPYTNFNFQYGCASVNVTVNGSTQQTSAIQVGGMAQASNSACASAGTSQTLDFSDIITGDGPVTVTISNAEYDNCSRFGSPYPAQYGMQYNCGMASVWLNHQMVVTATIETDGTYMVE